MRSNGGGGQAVRPGSPDNSEPERPGDIPTSSGFRSVRQSAGVLRVFLGRKLHPHGSPESCRETGKAVFTIKKAWPRAGFIEWELSGSGKLYEAEFNINGFEFDVKVDPEGKILLVKEEIVVSALPGPVRAAALKPYPGGRIKEAEKVTEGGVIRYKVEVVDHLDDYDVLLTPEGDILYVDH